MAGSVKTNSSSKKNKDRRATFEFLTCGNDGEDKLQSYLCQEGKDEFVPLTRRVKNVFLPVVRWAMVEFITCSQEGHDMFYLWPCQKRQTLVYGHEDHDKFVPVARRVKTKSSMTFPDSSSSSNVALRQRNQKAY